MNSFPDLASQLFQVNRLNRHLVAQELAPLGISPHQARALRVIRQGSQADDEVRNSDVAARLKIAPRSATEVIEALVERGWVKQEPSLRDKRAKALLITGSGEQALEDADTARARASVRLSYALTAKQAEQLGELLGIVLKNSQDELNR